MRDLVTPSIAAIVPYEPGKPIGELERELGITDAVKLASNENPLGPSPRAIEAIERELPRVHRYPDGGAHRLREHLAAMLGVHMDELVIGNGSNEVIELLVRTFATPADHAVFAENTFPVYRLACLAGGVPFAPVPLSDQRHDLDAMAEAVRPETRLLFIANPNNPTGTYVGKEQLAAFLRALPPEIIAVVDEAYFEYADAVDYPDALAMRDLRERLVVLRTFSKVHGLAALRVGFGVAPRALVEHIHRVRAPFNVGTLGQVGALAALDDAEHLRRSVTMNREERARLDRELRKRGLEPVPSQANFVLVDMRRDARQTYEALLRRGVIVRPLGSLPTMLRVTVGTPQENTRLLEALGEVLAS